MNEKHRLSMEVGYYFNKELHDDNRVDDWCGSEECATFTKVILDYAEENGCDIAAAFYEIMDSTIEGINNETIHTEDHMWDEYAKGFLAGEILGMPTKSNLDKVRQAEILWENSNCGYYQEVLETVR